MQQEKADKISLQILQKIPSFGFSNLVADWAFLQFIQYFGDTPARDQIGYALVPEYFAAVVNHDPRFVRAYLYFSTASSIFAGRPDRTVALMNHGLAYLSPAIADAYYIWLYKGVDEILFLGDTKAARHSYAMAAQWAKQSGNPQVAASAAQSAQFLAHNPDSKRAQASAWVSILANATDARVQHLALSRIQALGGKVRIMNQGGARFVSLEMPQND
ncbi:hypothetical protein [Neosynechococcus sphagnicola]|uniref:hypothetical protein n=1 Tax=Neosynechococcus sphagnicola TaxID=1501145 RepID=UPI0019553E7A|nr:hypothetical protein [Neosynechococcus sphagnicola]